MRSIGALINMYHFSGYLGGLLEEPRRASELAKLTWPGCIVRQTRAGQSGPLALVGMYQGRSHRRRGGTRAIMMPRPAPARRGRQPSW